jgi:hypothetical protein
MKKYLFLLAALFTLAAAGETIVGQSTVRQSLVTWSSTNWTLKTRVLFLGNNVYVDTSSTGQAGQFKRIDNTADSCSNPFPLVSDTNGTARPIWLYQLWETVRAINGDSSAHTYRVQTRERVWDNTTKQVRWTPWTRRGSGKGYVDVTIVDSLLVPATGSVPKVSTYALGFYMGSWARLCPDDNEGTDNGAADSVFADSLFHFTR